MKSGLKLIDELEAVANEHDATIYEILHRRAGWGVCWYEEKRGSGDNWKDGIVVYAYHDDLLTAIQAEHERFRGLK